MKFAVKALSNGRARAGSLQLGSFEIETPSLLLSTRKGLPFFISPDLLPSLPSAESRLLQFSPLHLYVKLHAFSHPLSSFHGLCINLSSFPLEYSADTRMASAPVLLQLQVFDGMTALGSVSDACSLDGLSPKTISKIGGLHQMLRLHDYEFVAVARDSIQCLPSHDATNKVGPSFDTPCGRRLIKPVEYMEMISSMRPNIWVTLADEVPAWVSDKRNASSVDRSVKWLDECLALRPMDGEVFGAIVGGSDEELRRHSAEEVAKRNVSGYWIGGFGLGESMDERPALLNAVCDNLPLEKPRLISGLDLPEEVLQGVATGIDLFDTKYIHHITLGGFALTFQLAGIEANASTFQQRDIGSDLVKINLRATIYRKDTTPIVEGCSCYTCRNHTRAYINHLLNVHEMLAQTLLELHNTYHYLGFFRLIRESIKEGKFERFCQRFIADRRDHLAVSVAYA